MAAIECADAHGDRQVKRLLIRLQLELLYCHLTIGELSCLDLSPRGGIRLGDGFGRSVDAEDEASADLLRDRARKGARPAADFKDPRATVKRQAFQYRRQPGRQRHGPLAQPSQRRRQPLRLGSAGVVVGAGLLDGLGLGTLGERRVA